MDAGLPAGPIAHWPVGVSPRRPSLCARGRLGRARIEGHWAGAMLMQLLSALRVSVHAEPAHRIPQPCKTMQRDHPLKQHILVTYFHSPRGLESMTCRTPFGLVRPIAIHVTRTRIFPKEDSVLQVALFFLSGRFRLQRYGRTYRSTLAVSVWAIRSGHTSVHMTPPLSHRVD